MARKRQRGEMENRLSLGRQPEEARFPTTPAKAGLPREYADALGAIKQRIQEERLRVVLAANAAMVSLYWDIGQMILERQVRAGWGAKVIDRLAADLHEAFPDMRGFSSRNLKYMRAFAAAWPEREFVQQAAARIPWFHNCLLLDRVPDAATREWYIKAAAPYKCLVPLWPPHLYGAGSPASRHSAIMSRKKCLATSSLGVPRLEASPEGPAPVPTGRG